MGNDDLRNNKRRSVDARKRYALKEKDAMTSAYRMEKDNK